MPRRVVITGTGVISALADSSQGLHNALCQGRNGWGSIERFDTEEIACQLGGEIKDFSPNTYLGNKNFRPLDRISQLSASAAQQALSNSGWSEQMREKAEVGLVLGTMFSSVHTIAEFDRRAITLGPRAVKPLDFANTVINAASGQTAIWHNLRGINSTVANGIASGLQALCYAADLIRCGQSTALLAGGAEELAFEAVYGFSRAGLLPPKDEPHPIPFDARRNGFIPSEGAAFLMLEEAEAARVRGASVLAEIRGYSTAFNSPRKKTDQTATIKRALQGALTDAELPADSIQVISASANGSIREDRLEAEALAGVFGAEGPPVTAVKSMLGEALGASGAFQAVALLESMHKGVLPGIRGLDQIDVPLKSIIPENKMATMGYGLVNAFGFDGNGCALILSIPEKAQ